MKENMNVLEYEIKKSSQMIKQSLWLMLNFLFGPPDVLFCDCFLDFINFVENKVYE